MCGMASEGEQTYTMQNFIQSIQTAYWELARIFKELGESILKEIYIKPQKKQSFEIPYTYKGRFKQQCFFYCYKGRRSTYRRKRKPP